MTPRIAIFTLVAAGLVLELEVEVEPFTVVVVVVVASALSKYVYVSWYSVLRTKVSVKMEGITKVTVS